MSNSVRKTAAQWSELVDEFNKGSESERGFCARHDVKLATLRKWRYHYKKQSSGGKSSSAFSRVSVRAGRELSNGAVLCIGPDIRLECPTSYDVPALAELALAVHRGR